MSDPSKRRFRVRPVFLVLMPGLFFNSPDRSLAQDTTTGNARQPTISNQFTAATGGALQQRRPGLTVQQGIAIHNGATGFIVGDAEPDQNFVGDTFKLIIQTIIDTINQSLSVLNLASGNNPLSGLIDQIGTAPQTGDTTDQAGMSARTVASGRFISPTHPIPMTDIGP